MPTVIPLRRRREFARVLSEGRRGRSGPVVALVAPGADAGGRSRVGLAVRSGRGGAVARNRARRRLRAAFRAAGIERRDVLLRGEPEVASIDFQELVDSVRGAVREAER